MATQRKRLTPEQQAMIPDLVLREQLSYAEIGKKFGVSEDSIYRWCKKNYVDSTKRTPTDWTGAVKEKKTSDKREILRQEFLKTDRYKKIAQIYDPSSLSYFLEQWIDWHIQLKDVTTSEEDAIELAIMTKLRLQDNQEKYSKYNAMLREMEKRLMELDMTLDASDDEQRILHEKIQAADLIQLDLNKDINNLLDKFKDLQKALNASREQREKNQKIGGDTFTSLVTVFSDRNNRQELENDEEIWRLATLNQVHKMKRPIEFEDGSVEPIIMDGSDYLDGKSDGSDDRDETEDSDEKSR